MRHYNIKGVDIVITRRLYFYLVHLKAELLHQGEVFVPHIDWVRFESPAKSGSYEWAMHFLPARALSADSRLTCGAVAIYINEENRKRLAGKILDFVDKRLQVRDVKAVYPD